MKKRNKEEEVKETRTTLWDVIYYLALCCILVGLMLNQQASGSPRVVGGYSVFHVLSSSMQSEIPKDSLVVTKEVDIGSLEIGDDITYMVGPATSVTHRIVGIIEDYSGGESGFETKGLENKHKDSGIVPASNIVGKVIYHNYYLGRVGGFVSNNWHLILIYLILYIFIKKGLLAYMLRGEDEEGLTGEEVEQLSTNLEAHLEDILCEGFQGYPIQDFQPQGYQAQDFQPQGYPPQGYQAQGYPPQSYPIQDYPQQGYPIPQDWNQQGGEPDDY